jgi:NAD(P)-dependent dehydrogenase (short-subunit alcohol dehydrogenase family)
MSAAPSAGHVRLDGAAIVVTGAGGAFGAAYARHLAGLGAGLVLNDVDGERLEEVGAGLRATGAQAVEVVGSVSDWALAATLTAVAVERFGRLDGLVNAAGLWTASEPWAESEADVRAVIETNVLGTFACGASAARAMKAAGGGSIVNISSTAAFGLSRLGAYGASKAAMLALTRSWALDLRPFGVTVNAVAPTGLTPMSRRYRSMLDELGIPSAAPPPPPVEATVGIVGFLCSDLARSVTGQMLWVADGELATIETGGEHRAVVAIDASDADEVAAAFASGALGKAEQLS